MSKFFITSAIPYVNAPPHIGHALEFIQTDVIARYRRLLGDEVLKLSGGDENALKNVQAAEKVGLGIQEFVDKNTTYFYQLAEKLNAKFDVWQKGSDFNHHYVSSQKLWNLCRNNGDIYTKSYRGLYCGGCEAFYTPDELSENGECFEHPGKKVEVVEEKNYFFKLSKYQSQLIELIESGKLEIVPEKRKNEILSFLRDDLKDISISRSNTRAKDWGVPVPGDDAQKIYVWFDALNIYQTGIGFGWNEEMYKKWWPADLHVIGKGILRFHAIYWPAFLISASLALPKKIFVHEYFTVDGQKMSKTVGNVYDPIPVLEKMGADPLRYFCLAKISPFSDGDFSEEKFFQAYNSDLANGIGNVLSRVAKLASISGAKYCEKPYSIHEIFFQSIRNDIEEFRFDTAISSVWGWISHLDGLISEDKPWEKEGKELESCVKNYLELINRIATGLEPFLPETSDTIKKKFLCLNGEPTLIEPMEPLFMRLPK